MDVKIVAQMWTILASLLLMVTNKQKEKTKRKINQLGNLEMEYKIQNSQSEEFIKHLKITNYLAIN